MKPKYHTALFRNPFVGATCAIVVCFGASVSQGATNLWTGTTDSQWNTATNWSLGHIPEKAVLDEDAVINTSTGNIATIVGANILKTPKDILIGNGTAGILNHISGDALTGGGNWMYAGKGAAGTYNLANTAVPGPGISGYALGSGNMIVSGNFYSGSGAGGDGTVNMNTSGTLSAGGTAVIGEACPGKMNLEAGTFSVGGELWVGQAGGGNGTFKMVAGGMTVNNWVAIGRNGGTGKLTVEGGIFTKSGGGSFAVGNGGSGKGELVQSGGTVTTNGVLRIADGTGAAGSGKYTMSGGTLNVNNECWIGQGGGSPGTLELSGGQINVTNWVAVGRDGNGTFNMSGGTFTKNGGGNFLVCGAGTGTMNMTGGLLDVQTGEIQIPENGNGTLSLSGASSEILGNTVRVGTNGGSTGNLNLNGGTLRVTQIIGGGGATRAVAFNGTQIVAKAASTTFINNLTAATIGSTGGTGGTGGLRIDSNNFSLTAPQIFLGGGGVVKSGIKTLTLSAANTYTGPTTVLEGNLFTTTASDATGAITLSDFTGFGLTQTAINDTYSTSAISFGFNDNTLNFDLGAFAGNTTSAPLTVTGIAGSLNVNGDVLVDIADTNIVTGSIPLISYNGLKGGSGNFVLRALPDGVIANLVLTNIAGPSSLSLNVTRANDPYWTGTTSNLWNTADLNWKNEFGAVATSYADGDPAMFDDRVDTGPTTVVLNTTVTPGGSGVTFNNTAKNYTLSTTSTGKITGPTGLLKLGTGSLDISTANDYDGNTTITAGTINVATLADAGFASPISKDGLFLNGGTLNYTGPNKTIDRGFSITAANSGITTTNNLTMTGPVYSTAGGLIKLGTGNLTLTNDAVTIGASGQVSKVNNGTLSLIGSGSQLVSVPGELWVGSITATPGALVLQNTSLTVGSWFTLGRGNGDTGLTSSFTATGSVIATGNLSTGFNGDLPTNNSVQTISLNNSTWTNTGLTLFAESQNSQTNITLSGASSFTGTGTRMALGANSACNLTLSGTSSFNGGVCEIAVASPSNALITQTGGTATFGNNEHLWFGQGGHAIWNQSAGSTTCNGYLVIGRGGSAVAEWNVSGGTLTQSPPAPGDYPGVILAEAGKGTLTISGGGEVVSNGQQVNIATAGGNGTLNLNVGGTLRANRVIETNAGTSALTFDGGTLVANTAANLDFVNGIDTVTVKSNGAKIDTNGKTIAISPPLLDGTGGGGLTKSGAGFLQLNGVNTYTGTTNATAGSLGGTGTVAGPLVVSAAGTLAPGVAVGTFTAGASTISGTYACEVSGATADKLVANGTLNVSAAALVITEITPANGAPLIIASYTGATPAPFASVTGKPNGYSVVYNYGGNQIALVASGSSYSTWAQNNITAINPSANATMAGDPDGDGSSNLAEFALNGNPLSGTSSGKVVGKVAIVGGSPTLVLTLPVRTGAIFSGATEQVSALIDGVVYKIQGSDELATWNLAVSEVPVGLDKTNIESTMPPQGSTDWTYRTFQSPGAITGDPADFLRAIITAP
ncbi:MAG: autotransporter-associated beta strand repeat-containing protein [Luteolibacter sp.]